MKEHYFDIPLEAEIKNTERMLEMLKNRNPDAVFHCPICKKDFRDIGNYRELKMCSKCYVDTETAKLQEQTKDLIGSVIQNVEVVKPSPYGVISSRGVGIKQLTVKLPNGKTAKLFRENQPCLLF